MGTKNGVISPAQKKCHFYGRSKNKSKKIKGDSFKFLIFTALETKMIATRKLALPVKLKEKSVYSAEKEFFDFNIKVIKQRMCENVNDFYIFYNRQKGKCEFCNKSMKLNFISENKELELLGIYIIKPLSIGRKYENYCNKTLLHKGCYIRVYKILGKVQISKMTSKNL